MVQFFGLKGEGKKPKGPKQSKSLQTRNPTRQNATVGTKWLASFKD